MLYVHSVMQKTHSYSFCIIFPRPSPQRRGKAIVGRLWEFLEQRLEEKTPRRRGPASER